jgi:hypothetical protein
MSNCYETDPISKLTVIVEELQYEIQISKLTSMVDKLQREVRKKRYNSGKAYVCFLPIIISIIFIF